MVLVILEAQQTECICTVALNPFKHCIFSEKEVKYMTFPDIAAIQALTVESRGGFLLPQTREFLLTGQLWNIGYCLVEVKI